MAIDITPNPSELPSLNDPATFNPRALALFDWLIGTFIPELEAISGSDLGEVQANTYDSAAGKLLLTGAFGLGLRQGGSPVATDNVDDVNLPAGPSLYLGGSTLNKPFGLNGGGMVWRGWGGAAGGQGEQHQLVGSRLANASGVPDILYRTLADQGGWADWVRLLHARNLLGTVSKNGNGQATGAVIETGGNGNGTYARFADGTQICTRSNFSFNSITTATGSIFVSDSDTEWTFPAEFATGPAVNGNRMFGGDYWLIGPSTTPSDPTASYRGRLASGTSTAGTRSVNLVAVGQW